MDNTLDLTQNIQKSSANYGENFAGFDMNVSGDYVGEIVPIYILMGSVGRRC